jgi:hypothetical protein
LDACFKGCGNAFHDMMATKDLLDVVVRIVVTETLQARFPRHTARCVAITCVNSPPAR